MVARYIRDSGSSLGDNIKNNARGRVDKASKYLHPRVKVISPKHCKHMADVLALKMEFDVQYGSTGCGVFKRGIEN